MHSGSLAARFSRHSLLRAFAVGALSLLLSACPTGTRPPAQRPANVPALPTPDLSGAVVYAVNAAESNVDVLVYRGGTLARLGHNHVMTSRALRGRVWIHPTLARSGFDLSFPVNELVVDDPEARQRAGGAAKEFPPDIPQADRDGTRKNMLRAEVLDGERFATVKLQSVKISGTLQAPTIATRITIKDVSRDIEVPAAVAVEGTRVTARGAFDIEQTAFGIKPFSIGMGAMEVQNRLHIEFRVVANSSASGT
jgi:hypothetical protein